MLALCIAVLPQNRFSCEWLQPIVGPGENKGEAWKMADDGAIVVCHSQRPGSTISQGAQSIRMTGGLIGSSATGPSTIAHHSYGPQLATQSHLYNQRYIHSRSQFELLPMCLSIHNKSPILFRSSICMILMNIVTFTDSACGAPVEKVQ